MTEQVTEHMTVSVLGILSWMREHQSEGYVTVDAIAAPFELNRDQMRRNLQWLQRYECVKRGGDQSAMWSITDRGRVRLAEGRFSPSGAFLSQFDRAESFPIDNTDPARESMLLTAPTTAETTLPDLEDAFTILQRRYPAQ